MGSWGSANADALSWYLATDRSDFTFRTGMFAGFPAACRPTSGFNAQVGQKYHFDVEIDSTTASYSIDGMSYAIATYAVADVPQ